MAVLVTATVPDRVEPEQDDVVDAWGEQSFPASDPPQNW